MISLSGLVYAVVTLIIAGLIAGLLWWLIDFCKTPEPVNRIAKVIVAVGLVLVCIASLLSLAGVRLFAP